MRGLVSAIGLVLCVGLLQAQNYKVRSVTELESALNSATSGQVIAIVGGTFELNKVLPIAAGVTVQGGYNSDFSSRDVVSNETILDGKGATDLLAADGSAGWVLDGLTLAGGFANDPPTNVVVNGDGTVSADRISGSALRLVNGAEGTLKNVKVTKNNISSVQKVHEDAGKKYYLDNNGCAIFVGGASKLTIENSKISENFDVNQVYLTETDSVIDRRSGAVILAQTTGAGGIIIKDSYLIDNPSASQSVLDVMKVVGEANAWGQYFAGATADTLGGGLVVVSGGDQSWITGCTIRNNMVGGQAVSGIIATTSVAVFVVDRYTTIEQNYSQAGGININAGFVLLENLIIRDNASLAAFLQAETEPAPPRNFEVNNILVERNRCAQGRFMYTRFTNKGLFTNSIIRNNYSAPRGDRILEMRSVGAGPTEDLGLAVFSHNILENNFDPRRPGIEFTANRAEISNNVIRGNNTMQSTIQIEAYMAELYMFNNVLMDNIVHASSEGRILEMRGAKGDIFVFNNTLFNNEAQQMEIVGFRDQNLTTVGFKNNLFYHNLADSGQGYLFGSLAFQQDFVKISNNLVGAWEGNVRGWDPREPPFFSPILNNNIDLGNGNPKFVSMLESIRGTGPGGTVYLHNLSLLDGAPAKDTGTDPSDFYGHPYPSWTAGEPLYADPAKDINGIARETGKWDIGAYEGQQILSGVQEKVQTVLQYQLAQSYPNPFNPTTKINFTVPKDEHVALVVYDALGRQVATLVDDKMNAGTHTVQFDASTLPSGVYFCRLEAGSVAKTMKMMLLK